MDKSVNNLIVFDVCGTLYRSNTTYDFLAYYFNKKNKRKYIVLKFWYSTPGKVISKFLSFFNLENMIRKRIIGLIAGERENEVRAEAKNFVDEVLCQLKIKFCHDFLNETIEKKSNKVYLASASIEPVISAIAMKLGVTNYFSTSLEVKNGCFTGNILEDVQGTKHIQVGNLKLNSNYKNLTVFTDNKEDLNLVLQADEAFLMIYGSNEKFWIKKTQDHSNSNFIKVTQC